MSEREKEEGKGFKIVDRRRFTTEGELKADAPPDTPRPTPPAEAPRPAAPAKGDKPESKRYESGIDFMTFVASLATNALAAMGALPEGRAAGMPLDPGMAREYIDIIDMLSDKTRGNLSAQEEQSLKRLLGELKMQYVEFTRAVTRPPAPPRR